MSEPPSQPQEWKESFLNSQCSIVVSSPGPITTTNITDTTTDTTTTTSTGTPFTITLSIDKNINIFFKPLRDGGYQSPALFLRRRKPHPHCHSHDDRDGDTTQCDDSYRLDIEGTLEPTYSEPKEPVTRGLWTGWEATRGQWTWEGLTFDRAGEWLVYFTFLEEEYWGALCGSQCQAYLTHMSIPIVDAE